MIETSYSLLDLKSIVDNGKNKVILQQRIEGLDYTVSALADKGVVTHICGYVGYMMAFGSIMYLFSPNLLNREVSLHFLSSTTAKPLPPA